MTAPAPYQIPNCLKDLVMVDLLELTGSTISAAEWLSISQPTVSRRYRALASELQLKRRPEALPGQRYGDTPWLELLRRGVNRHRLESGVLRIGGREEHRQHVVSFTRIEWVSLSALAYGHWPNLLRAELLDGVVVTNGSEPVEPPWATHALHNGTREMLTVACRLDGTVRELLESLSG